MNPTQKIAEIYKQMRLDEAKKKMDPVGDADADIDNDGDVDDSDEYLHNRRKAIKKGMKEEKCPECGKEPCECEDEDDVDEMCSSKKGKKEALEIDPDDGETKKVSGKEDEKKKKKAGTETETDGETVAEAALKVDMKQPTQVDDTEEAGHKDAVSAGRAGPSTKYRAGDNKQGDRKPLKKFKEMRK
jgi:hypothetical protein